MLFRIFKEPELKGYGYDVDTCLVCSFKKGNGPMPMAKKSSYRLNGIRYTHNELVDKMITAIMIG